MKNIPTKVLLLVLGIVLNGYSGFTQSYECGTEATKDIIKKSVAERKKRANNNRHKSSETLYVKVQPHIIRSTNGSGGLTTGELDIAMQALNDRYAPANMVFNICAVKYIENDRYHNKLIKGSYDFQNMYNNASIAGDAVNVFFAQNLGINVLGWASFPSKYPEENWVVVRNDTYSDGSTLAHEIGHYFGLFHTHTIINGTENVTRDPDQACWNCEDSGDTFCDTPADPNLDGKVANVTSCDYQFLGLDNCGETYAPDSKNIMSYSKETCVRNFSASQCSELRNIRKYVRDYISDDYSGLPIPSSLYQLNACEKYSISTVGDLVHNRTAKSDITAPIYNSSLTNTATIAPSVKVNFKAGKYIDLMPGFTAAYESRFDAFIGSCEIEAGPKGSNQNAELILRNFPNPFNGETTIEYTLPNQKPVTLFVTDMMGKKVAILLNNEEQTKGYHTITFDGSNYSPGMYYCTLQAGDHIKTQKMILMP